MVSASNGSPAHLAHRPPWQPVVDARTGWALARLAADLPLAAARRCPAGQDLAGRRSGRVRQIRDQSGPARRAAASVAADRARWGFGLPPGSFGLHVRRVIGCAGRRDDRHGAMRWRLDDRHRPNAVGWLDDAIAGTATRHVGRPRGQGRRHRRLRTAAIRGRLGRLLRQHRNRAGQHAQQNGPAEKLHCFFLGLRWDRLTPRLRQTDRDGLPRAAAHLVTGRLKLAMLELVHHALDGSRFGRALMGHVPSPWLRDVISTPGHLGCCRNRVRFGEDRP